jgi:hypothetical protein
MEMCDCFTCKNKDNVEALYGYYKSLLEHATTTYNDLKEAGITPTNINDSSIGGVMCRCKHEMDTATGFLNEIEEKRSKTLVKKAFDFGDVQINVSANDNSTYIASRIDLIATIIQNLFAKRSKGDID